MNIKERVKSSRTSRGRYDLLLRISATHCRQLTDLGESAGRERAVHRGEKQFHEPGAGQLGKPDVSDFLKGPTATTFIRKDVGPVAKILMDFSREVPLVVKEAS